MFLLLRRIEREGCGQSFAGRVARAHITCTFLAACLNSILRRVCAVIATSR